MKTFKQFLLGYGIVSCRKYFQDLQENAASTFSVETETALTLKAVAFHELLTCQEFTVP